MQDRSSHDDTPKTLMARLDRVAREMNAFLVVLAIGLAALDATCYWAKTVSEAFARHRPPAAAVRPASLQAPAVTVSAAEPPPAAIP